MLGREGCRGGGCLLLYLLERKSVRRGGTMRWLKLLEAGEGEAEAGCGP